MGLAGVIAGGVALYLALYLLAGWRLAVRGLPAAWERARVRHYRSAAEVAAADAIIRRVTEPYVASSVRAYMTLMVLVWPLAWPQIRIKRVIGRTLTNASERADPVALRRKLAEREMHIASLERELGIPASRPAP